jgi:uncharacterized protein YwlG (UPF0340 family)
LHHVVEETLLILHTELLSQAIKGVQRVFSDKLFVWNTNDSEVSPEVLGSFGHEDVKDLLLVFGITSACTHRGVLLAEVCQVYLKM